MKVSSGTDPGCKRKNNEDFLFVDTERNLFIIADGMGGHQAGEKASKLAVETAEQFLTKEKISRIICTEGDIKEAINESIGTANKVILEESRLHRKLSGMGCTIIIAIAEGNLFHIGHVGDVRAYVICEDTISLLTEDHTVINELIKSKRITSEEAKKHPLKHVLSKAVGNKDKVEPDYNQILIKPGDYLLLCSDGLTTMIDDNLIKDIVVEEKDTEKIKEKLMEKAKEFGGKDNITVILIHIEENDIIKAQNLPQYQEETDNRFKTQRLKLPPKPPWWKFW